MMMVCYLPDIKVVIMHSTGRTTTYPVRSRGKSRKAICPGCGSRSRFNYVGEQHCPPRLVKLRGGPVAFGLWTCADCHTTVSEFSLRE